MIAVSRDQLHEEIWAEPMTTVAGRYGISDVALGKICLRHRIPTPPRGYWAKLAAGKKVKKTHYVRVSDPNLNNIKIYGGENLMSEAVAQKVRAVTEKDKKSVRRPTSLPKNPDEKFHRIALLLQRGLKKAKPDNNGLYRVSGKPGLLINIGSASFDRVVTFVHIFCMQVEKRGYEFKLLDNILALQVEGEVLKFEIKEKTDRTPHIETDKEVKARKVWEKKARTKSYNWEDSKFISSSFGRPKIPDFDYTPNGLLVFQFTETNYNGLRRTFGDGKTQNIEGMIDDIFSAAAKLAAANQAQREEWARFARESEERKQIAEEKQKLENLERHRAQGFMAMSSAWKKVNELRQFVEVIKLHLEESDDRKSTLEWIVWAEHHIEETDPLSNGLPKLLQRGDFSEWELSRFENKIR